MSRWPFRFVHAADFHLETPPFGIAEAPEHLGELFLEAAYGAAGRVFETALSEEVDFLILSGDVLDCRHTGPRGPLFLVEQFERLAERDIIVYWAGGRVDPPEAWPPSIRLPDNVHVFLQGTVDTRVFHRDDTPLVRLLGTSRARGGRIRPAQFDPSEPGLFSIAVAHGKVTSDDLKSSRVDYWALGGRHAAKTYSRTAPMAHCPGSPQGRQPEETGPHGCTLVKVDTERNIELSQVATDVMRWQHEQISVDAQTDRAALEKALREKVEALGDSATDGDRLISWTVTGSGPLVAQLRQGPLADELLGQLCHQYGYDSPARWSVSLSVEPQAVPKTWLEQETIRGDFLRAVQEYRQHDETDWGLETFLPEDAPAELIAAASESASREAVLGQTGMLGVDLLSGEESDS
ncbi:MAG: hypothetical protein JW818_01615 [Pirellulales bacterium]|nr:hypothetical protein [Pirellulales bacterium]